MTSPTGQRVARPRSLPTRTLRLLPAPAAGARHSRRPSRAHVKLPCAAVHRLAAQYLIANLRTANLPPPTACCSPSCFLSQTFTTTHLLHPSRAADAHIHFPIPTTLSSVPACPCPTHRPVTRLLPEPPRPRYPTIHHEHHHSLSLIRRSYPLLDVVALAITAVLLLSAIKLSIEPPSVKLSGSIVEPAIARPPSTRQ